MEKPALGLIELKSIARGIITADAVVKKAPIRLLGTHPICPGKYMIIFGGEVADVEESLKIGIETSGDLIVNHLFLPYMHHDIIPAITATTQIEHFGALGIIESFSVASCIVAADKAAKTSPAKLIEIRLANGLGGKAYFVMTGELCDIEVSIDEARAHIQAEGLLVDSEIIPAPHPELLEKSVYFTGKIENGIE